jgi:hypothetical protein
MTAAGQLACRAREATMDALIGIQVVLTPRQAVGIDRPALPIMAFFFPVRVDGDHADDDRDEHGGQNA